MDYSIGKIEKYGQLGIKFCLEVFWQETFKLKACKHLPAPEESTCFFVFFNSSLLHSGNCFLFMYLSLSVPLEVVKLPRFTAKWTTSGPNTMNPKLHSVRGSYQFGPVERWTGSLTWARLAASHQTDQSLEEFQLAASVWERDEPRRPPGTEAPHSRAADKGATTIPQCFKVYI